MTVMAPPEVYFTAKGQMSGQPLLLDDTRLAVLWDRMSQFPSLFSTTEERSYPVFRDWLEAPGTLVIGFYHADEREPVGLGMVYGILPGVDVKIQISFFDGELKKREPVVRAFIGWVLETVGTRRVSAHLRQDTRAMQFFLVRVGMCAEGVLKDWSEQDGKCYDLYLYGVTARECTAAWLGGQSSAKQRIRMPKQRTPSHGHGTINPDKEG